MLFHYLQSGLRDAARNKLYTVINVVGLSVGLTCSIFVMLFIADALSYDKWIPGYQNLYRAEVSLFFPGTPPMPTVSSPFQFATSAQAEVPEISGVARLVREYTTIRYRDQPFSEHIAVVNPEFFSIIRLPFVSGNSAALNQPDSVVISQSYARKYFGQGNPLGHVLVFGSSTDLVVRGVLADLPDNSQLVGDVFIPDDSRADRLSQDEKTNWFAFNGYTYARLVPGANVRLVEEKLRAVFARHIDPAALTGLSISASQLVRVHLEPFGDVHC